MDAFKKTNSPCGVCNNRYKITIVGLGLIGGSLALALKGFKNAEIFGIDINSSVIKKALDSGAVDKASLNSSEGFENADLIIICVSPEYINQIIKENIAFIKPGAVITDVCGTKMLLYKDTQALIPSDIEYIGIHPMAGKEVGGFENADKNLFLNTGFIITPLKNTKNRTIALMEELAEYIGAKRIAKAKGELHDDIIAYTSDLMHISATALCIDFHPQMNNAYTAGAFRDCTRVGNIDASLWAELLLYNGEKILPHLERHIKNLENFKTALENKDKNLLFSLLALGGENKREMLKR